MKNYDAPAAADLLGISVEMYCTEITKSDKVPRLQDMTWFFLIMIHHVFFNKGQLKINPLLLRDPHCLDYRRSHCLYYDRLMAGHLSHCLYCDRSMAGRLLSVCAATPVSLSAVTVATWPLPEPSSCF